MRTDDSTQPPRELLEQHRRDIEALDRRILHLVCERLELARQIGELKQAAGIPLRNFKVEAEVYQRFADASSLLGLDEVLGRDLATFLIRKAVEAQAAHRDTVYQGNALRTLVVGGKGGMGRWIARFLQGQGHRVVIHDPADCDSNFPQMALDEAAAEADLIVVAVPMSACAGVLEELARLRVPGVVAEMCSLKGHLREQSDRLRGNGLRLVSFHPLFGPDVRMLSGRTIVFCSEARPEDLAVVHGLFAETSARLVEVSISEHDRRMGLVLGLTHLSNLVFARALSHSNLTAADLDEVAGVTFTKQLGTTREVTGENPGLYFEIQVLNETTPETGRCLRQALDEWLEAVENGDAPAFERLMADCHGYLGPGTDGATT
ncbi:MAG: prephenate dehydrogenase/arogenate dehydrogenase family protein [Acidobacteriota bacterium]|nr:prephenate dehydrogenase/arogenate dehydrogenase family protein [Acidobacteriota bacterium]